MTTGYKAELRNAQLDAITSFIGNAGKLQIYSGTRPATGAAITTQTKLAEFTLGSPFAGAAAAGELTPTTPADTTGLADGTPTWFRITTSAGGFCIDGSAGTASADAILNTASISTGVAVSVTSFTISRGNA